MEIFALLSAKFWWLDAEKRKNGESSYFYHEDLQKREVCCVVAHERHDSHVLQ